MLADNPKILEIGSAGYFKAVRPETTRYFPTENWPDLMNGGAYPSDPSSLWSLVRNLARNENDLIVCMPATRSPWHWQTLARMIGNRRIAANLHRPLRYWGPQLLRLFRSKPLIVVDFADTPYIDADNFFLLDRATLYFKRELPPDEWRLLTKTASSTQPSKRLRTSKRMRRRLDKIRPLPLGLPLRSTLDLPVTPANKKSDIFFAGTVKGFPVRERALAELETLRREGYVIDRPDQKLSPVEFYKRCAEAWLTLSPEGHGWDCFRHYEAAACGSVPLINTPSIRRHAPLIEGEHALFFDVEEGALAKAARQALMDKDRLSRIAEAGQAHVLANHTPEAIARYIVETSREALAKV